MDIFKDSSAMKNYLLFIPFFLFLAASTANSQSSLIYDVVAPSTDGDGTFTVSWSVPPDQVTNGTGHECLGVEVEFVSDGTLYDSFSTTDCFAQQSYTASGLPDGTYDIYLSAGVMFWEGGWFGSFVVPYDQPVVTVVGGGGGSGTPGAHLNESFETGFGSWVSSNSYLLRRSGNTPSGSTGPSSASDGSDYIYFETSNGYANSWGQTALLSNTIFSDENGLLSFDYHMYGSNTGRLRLEADSYNGNGNYTTIWEADGQQHSSTSAGWSTATVLLESSYTDLRFAFRAVGGYRGDIAIDNIRVSFGPLQDIDSTFTAFVHSNGTSIAFSASNSPVSGDPSLVWNAASQTYSPGIVSGTSGWQSAAIDLVFSDFNYDGAIDIAMTGVDSAVSGLNGIPDQLVFGSGQIGVPPRSVKAIDGETYAFFEQVYGWMLDQDYFTNNATSFQTVQETIVVDALIWSSQSGFSAQCLLKDQCVTHFGFLSQIYDEETCYLLENDGISCDDTRYWSIGWDEETISVQVPVNTEFVDDAEEIVDILEPIFWGDGIGTIGESDTDAAIVIVESILDEPISLVLERAFEEFPLPDTIPEELPELDPQALPDLDDKPKGPAVRIGVLARALVVLGSIYTCLLYTSPSPRDS